MNDVHMNTNNTVDEGLDAGPWYREFWAWFILTPLIVVVITCSITVTIAVRNADDRVVDNYYKEGRMINFRHDQDLLAKSLSMEAKVNFDRELGELTVFLTGDGALPEKLTLNVSHPAKARLDQQLTLTRVAENQYHAELLTPFLSHRWYLKMVPERDENSEATNSDDNNIADGADSQSIWRLRGEIDLSKTSTVIVKP